VGPSGADVQTTGWAIHIMAKGMDKVVGLVKACELMGLGLDDVAAIGDSENDIRMIERCGWGVAVGNADERTKARASFVTDGEHGRGVVEALEWLRVVPD